MRKLTLLFILLLTRIAFSETSGQILDANDDPFYIATPFDGNDLRGIQYVQINDVMFLAHPNHPVQKLIRFDHDDWTIADANFTWGPFLDDNTTTTTVTPSGVTGSITLTASSALWDANHVGALWKITEIADNSAINGILDANESSATVAIEGDGLLKLEGTWQGLVTLEKSSDGANFDSVYPTFQPASLATNKEYSFNEDAPGFSYRVTMSQFGSGSCNFSLVAYNTSVNGYVEITAVSDSTTATATVRSTLANTKAVTTWAEGAFSDKRGFPRGITIYQNRLCLAGTTFQPTHFWTSAAGGDFENMRASSLADGAIVFEVGASKQNPILWLQDKQGVIAGTTGSAIRIFSQSNTATLTNDSIGAERQSQAGSADMQAQLIKDSIVFVDRNRRKVNDIIFNLQTDSFVSPELTIFAEHITEPNLLEVAVQNRPDPILWYIRGDGRCVSLTYNREQSVVAWTEHITDGNFESVAVIPGIDEDEVWFVIKRTIDGSDVRYVEKLKPQDWGSDPNNAWFVDSGLEYTGVATSSFTGLGHLEGETVQIFHSGTEFDTGVVSGGIVSISSSVTQAVIGKQYTTTLTTFPVEFNLSSGATVGSKKRIYSIVPCFFRTMNGQYGLEGQFVTATMYPILFNEWPDTTNGSEAPFTGQIKLSIDGGWDSEVRVKFIQDEPYPFNLTALVTNIEVSE